ncbi:unannotated protein [freshwater metagenome]|uniref:Unannotated protein n=1 Tax=freshwater metagenome TaxID=449393 RepID=A0A6J7BMR6_9ZZZZ
MRDHHAVNGVTFDIHSKNIGGVLANFVDGLSDLHSAGLTAPAYFYLSLNNNNATDLFGGRYGLGYRGSDTALEYWNTVTFKEIPRLIFV